MLPDRKLNYKAFDKMEVSPQGRVVSNKRLNHVLGIVKGKQDLQNIK